jgi:hypothetical protein
MLLHLRKKAGVIAILWLLVVVAIVARQVPDRLRLVFRQRLVLLQLCHIPLVVATEQSCLRLHHLTQESMGCTRRCRSWLPAPWMIQDWQAWHIAIL